MGCSLFKREGGVKGGGLKILGLGGFNLKVGLVNMDPQLNKNVCSFLKTQGPLMQCSKF